MLKILQARLQQYVNRELPDVSTQSQFPYLWSAALRCTHGMAILGDPGWGDQGVGAGPGPSSASGGQEVHSSRITEAWLGEF